MIISFIIHGGNTMKSTYTPKGVCSRKIELDVEDGIIKSVAFTDGCDGNLQGISRLVEGMAVGEAIAKLKGIRCGRRATSCPDQLALALEAMR
jgi:uncharacterized protein (TIGR03905 family)